ncbi:MAG: N-acetylmuramoyl-L-alanine amidase [Lachnospiraceae bacterium]|nr:N-acetylmuramoyl-L-alanine amidase [Lachnospiraceae bacterium]
MAYKIMIDAGHGGYDAGASYNGRLEKDDTLALALAVGEILSGMGYDVEYTRTTDVYDSPVQKARIGNASGADLFVSIHRNSSPTPNTYNGVQTLVYEDTGLKASLARSVNNELEKVGYRNINVVERPNLAVLRRTQMPAILVETGFINSDVDNNLLDTRFDDTAMAIAQGINNTLRSSGLADSSADRTVTAFNGYLPEDTENDNSNGLTDELDGNTDVNNTDGVNDSENSNNINGLNDNGNINNINVPNDNRNINNNNGRNNSMNPDSEDDDITKYQLLVGIFRGMGSAGYLMNSLINAGYNAMIYEDDGLYQVRVGIYNDIEEALIAARELRDRGYDPLVVRFEK